MTADNDSQLRGGNQRFFCKVIRLCSCLQNLLNYRPSTCCHPDLSGYFSLTNWQEL